MCSAHPWGLSAVKARQSSPRQARPCSSHMLLCPLPLASARTSTACATRRSAERAASTALVFHSAPPPQPFSVKMSPQCQSPECAPHANTISRTRPAPCRSLECAQLHVIFITPAAGRPRVTGLPAVGACAHKGAYIPLSGCTHASTGTRPTHPQTRHPRIHTHDGPASRHLQVGHCVGTSPSKCAACSTPRTAPHSMPHAAKPHSHSVHPPIQYEGVARPAQAHTVE